MTLKPSLPHLLFEVTAACNLRCRFCYNVHKRPGAEAPPAGGYSTAKRTLKRTFSQAKVQTVTFTGGEPLLAERILELVLWCRLRGAGVQVISNGNVADRETWKSLVDLGVGLFEIPQHAAGPGPHDALTGVEGSWDKARGSIERLVGLGADVVGVVVLTRENHLQVTETLAHLSRLGVRRVMLNRFNVGGAGIAHRAELELSGPELRAAFTAADQASQQLGVAVSSSVCTPMCVLDPRDFPRIPFGFCSPDAKRRPLTLDVAGDLRFCNHSPTVAGNVHQTPLADLLRSPLLTRWAKPPPYCKDCPDWIPCRGGCRAASEQLGLGLEREDPLVAGELSGGHGRTRG